MGKADHEAQIVGPYKGAAGTSPRAHRCFVRTSPVEGKMSLLLRQLALDTDRWFSGCHDILVTIIIKFPFSIGNSVQFPEEQPLGVVELLLKTEFHRFVAVFLTKILYPFFNEGGPPKLCLQITPALNTSPDIVIDKPEE